MAGIVHPSPQYGFRPATVNHSPSPFGFGFGLSHTSSLPAWQPQQMQPSYPSHLQAYSTSKSSQKRRHDDTDADESMDRSPTPERRFVKRNKPMRLPYGHGSGSREDGAALGRHDREGKSPEGDSSEGIDVGMLLASLPPESLLPILTSLITMHPSLRSTILSLIPRPTLETALNAVNQAAKKLRDEYPYSTSFSSPFSHEQPSSTEFGSGVFGVLRPFSSHVPHSSVGFDRSSQASAGMRDAYVISRLRPHINDFVSTAFSYLPYFSNVSQAPNMQSNQSKKEKISTSPSETFGYLSTLTDHLLSQPPLCQSTLAPLLVPRLLQEWYAWVDRVEAYLKEGGIFGSGAAQLWVETLDKYAEAKIKSTNSELPERCFETVRDKWVAAAGWLVGRSVPYTGR